MSNEKQHPPWVFPLAIAMLAFMLAEPWLENQVASWLSPQWAVVSALGAIRALIGLASFCALASKKNPLTSSYSWGTILMIAIAACIWTTEPLGEAIGSRIGIPTEFPIVRTVEKLMEVLCLVLSSFLLKPEAIHSKPKPEEREPAPPSHPEPPGSGHVHGTPPQARPQGQKRSGLPEHRRGG